MEQADKEFSRKCVIKIYPLPHCNDADCSNGVKTHQKLFFGVFIPEWIFTYFLKYLIFFKSP